MALARQPIPGCQEPAQRCSSAACDTSTARFHEPSALEQTALKLVDVQVLDHIIVAAADSMSFAELGLL
jgi:hypothetical protein